MSIAEHIPNTGQNPGQNLGPGARPGAGPAGVLGEALAAVRGLDQTLWSARSDEELVDTVVLVHQLSAALAAVEAGALAGPTSGTSPGPDCPTGRPPTG